jgi:hypothetical protein
VVSERLAVTPSGNAMTPRAITRKSGRSVTPPEHAAGHEMSLRVTAEEAYAWKRLSV